MTEASRDLRPSAEDPGNVAARLRGERDAGFEGVAMCAEAQADGVPCTELGRRCEECERVAQPSEPSAW